MPELSGRTLEDLQAEADLLEARSDLAYAEQYLFDAILINRIITMLSEQFPDHIRYIYRGVEDSKRDAEQAGATVDRAESAVEKAEQTWEGRED